MIPVTLYEYSLLREDVVMFDFMRSELGAVPCDRGACMGWLAIAAIVVLGTAQLVAADQIYCHGCLLDAGECAVYQCTNGSDDSCPSHPYRKYMTEHPASQGCYDTSDCSYSCDANCGSC